MPECFEDEIQKEQEWIEMIMKKILKRRKATKKYEEDVFQHGFDTERADD